MRESVAQLSRVFYSSTPEQKKQIYVKLLSCPPTETDVSEYLRILVENMEYHLNYFDNTLEVLFKLLENENLTVRQFPFF